MLALRTFASRMGIKGSRKIIKTAVCEKIIELKRKYDESDCTDGLFKSVSKDVTTVTITTNSFRLLNVIFHADNYDRLDERAASLEKDDLDSGKKTGQQYYEFLASEYNSDKEDYGENLYPEIIKCDPSIHGTMTWMKARTGFNKFIKQYEKCINNQSVSGTHDVLVDSLDKVEEDGKKLSDFGKGRILYTHELVLLFPGSLDEVAACLDKEVFRESCDPNRNKKTTKKRKETHSTPRGNDKSSNAQQAAIWTEDQGVWTRGVLIGVHQEAYGRLISEGERMKQSRRQKFNNLRSDDGSEKKIYKKR